MTQSTEKKIAVKVENLTKTFKIPLEASNGIKQKLINTLKGRKGYREFTPLNDISFEIEKGDFFGIVGRNGSGKSTLLKTIAGIYAPDQGLVQVNGKLVPFIELGVGFNPELTGRENVFLNGALLGFSRKEMEAMYDEIVEFAELGEFMEERLKNYSSGMQVRLAFSIAIKAEGDILLLDEVLAVGDEAFQRKCYEYFSSLKRAKKTVVLVTHDMSAVEKYCNKAILVEKGSIILSGNPKRVSSRYSDILNPHSIQKVEATQEEVEQKDANRVGDKRYEFTAVSIDIEDGEKYQSPITVKTSLLCNENVAGDMLFSYAVKDSQGKVLFGNKTKINSENKPNRQTEIPISVTFPNILGKGTYFIDLSVFNQEDNTYSDLWLDCLKFNIYTSESNGFAVIANSKFNVRN